MFVCVCFMKPHKKGMGADAIHPHAKQQKKKVAAFSWSVIYELQCRHFLSAIEGSGSV